MWPPALGGRPLSTQGLYGPFRCRPVPRRGGGGWDAGLGPLWPPAPGVSSMVGKDRGRPRRGSAAWWAKTVAARAGNASPCPGLLTSTAGGHKGPSPSSAPPPPLRNGRFPMASRSTTSPALGPAAWWAKTVTLARGMYRWPRIADLHRGRPQGPPPRIPAAPAPTGADPRFKKPTRVG